MRTGSGKKDQSLKNEMGGEGGGAGGGSGGEAGDRKEEEQDGVSVHSPCKAPLSSASSLSKKPDDEDAGLLNHEEDFSLPKSYFVKEES
ncbi:hypothetical protein V2J09_020028 [Rumex salicifolius]